MSLASKFPGRGKVGGSAGKVSRASMRQATYKKDGMSKTNGKVAKTGKSFTLGSNMGTWDSHVGKTNLFVNVPKKNKHPRTPPVLIKELGKGNHAFNLPSGKFGRVSNSTFSTRKVGVADDIMTPTYDRQIKLPSSKSKVGGSGKMKVGR